MSFFFSLFIYSNSKMKKQISRNHSSYEKKNIKRFYLCIFLSVNINYRSIYLCLPVLLTGLSIYQCSLYVVIPPYLSMFIHIYLSVYLSICLYRYLSIVNSINQPIHLHQLSDTLSGSILSSFYLSLCPHPCVTIYNIFYSWKKYPSKLFFVVIMLN